MNDESKKPCAPVEEEGRDTTTVFREEDPLCAALDEFLSNIDTENLSGDLQEKLK